MEIKYEGNIRDPFTLDQLEDIQVKSILDGQFGKVEYWGDSKDDETGRPYDFGGIMGSGIDFYIEDGRLHIFSGLGYFVRFDPRINNFMVSMDRYGDERDENTFPLSPVLTLPPPRTMGDFINAIELYLVSIYLDAFKTKKRMDRFRYERCSQPPTEIENDPDLPF